MSHAIDVLEVVSAVSPILCIAGSSQGCSSTGGATPLPLMVAVGCAVLFVSDQTAGTLISSPLCLHTKYIYVLTQCAQPTMLAADCDAQ